MLNERRVGASRLLANSGNDTNSRHICKLESKRTLHPKENLRAEPTEPGVAPGTVAPGNTATAVTGPVSCGGAGDQLKRPCRPLAWLGSGSGSGSGVRVRVRVRVGVRVRVRVKVSGQWSGTGLGLHMQCGRVTALKLGVITR